MAPGPAGPPGPPGDLASFPDPNSDHVDALKAFLHHFCIYLKISAEEVPLDVARSLYEIVRHISIIKDDGLKDAAKIKDL